MLRDRSRVCRPPITSVVRASVACAAVAAAAALAPAPIAHADVVAYLVNVHVRPGYNFPNADAALGGPVRPRGW